MRMEKRKKKLIAGITLLAIIILFITLRVWSLRNFSSVMKTEKYKTYVSEKKELSFEHPVSWYIREINIDSMVPNVCFISSQTDPYWICIMYSAKVNNEEELTKFLENEIIGNVTNSIITNQQLIDKDGEVWQSLSYDYEINKLIPFLHFDASCHVYGVIRSDGAYAIDFCSQKYALEEATPIFDRIFESLKIGD